MDCPPVAPLVMRSEATAMQCFLHATILSGMKTVQIKRRKSLIGIQLKALFKIDENTLMAKQTPCCIPLGCSHLCP